MLPPLQPYPASAQFYSQQPITQAWPGSSTAPGKPGGVAPFGNPNSLNPPFGSSAAPGSGAVNPSSSYPRAADVGAAASLPVAATASGWPAVTAGSTANTGSGRGGGFGRGAVGPAASHPSLTGCGAGPPAQAPPPVGAQPHTLQPPGRAFYSPGAGAGPGSLSASQRQSPDPAWGEGPDWDHNRDQLPEGGGGDEEGGGEGGSGGVALDREQDQDPELEQPPQLDDPEQLQAAQQQQQQLQAASNNPYLQLLSQAGVGVGGLSPYAGSLAAAAQAAHEVQQAALRKRVQRDIRRMLAGNRAYQHHVKGPPAMSAESLTALAQPKLRPGSMPDSQVVVNLPDPVEWARWKTDQLVISRLQGERRQVEREEEKRRAEEQLAVYRQHKTEAKQAKAEAKARAAAEDAAYRANMSAFLNHKGKLDLEDFRVRKEEQSERLSLMRSRQVKSLSAHHY